jgi:uncharacterized protein (TIGR02466 family)
MFPTLVCVEQLPQSDETNKKFIEKSLDLLKTLPQDSTWRCDTFNTLNRYDMLNDPMFSDLIKNITECVKNFALEHGAKVNNVSPIDAWINVAMPGHHQEYHIHTGSHFSVAYYVSAAKDSGNIVFRSFEADTDMFPLPLTLENYTSYKTFSIPPMTGHLVIFRSNLRHMVEKNLSNDPRISISINYILK